MNALSNMFQNKTERPKSYKTKNQHRRHHRCWAWR